MESGEETVSRNLMDILPRNVMEALLRLGQKYAAMGVELVLFGSFARGTARRFSDLDIGIRWKNGRSKHLYFQLRNDINLLPTIRKIELVDFSEAGERFEKEAMKDTIKLTDLVSEYHYSEE